jgi:hypothetical protein
VSTEVVTNYFYVHQLSGLRVKVVNVAERLLYKEFVQVISPGVDSVALSVDRH